jgi:hypothetical protein
LWHSDLRRLHPVEQQPRVLDLVGPFPMRVSAASVIVQSPSTARLLQRDAASSLRVTALGTNQLCER